MSEFKGREKNRKNHLFSGVFGRGLKISRHLNEDDGKDW